MRDIKKNDKPIGVFDSGVGGLSTLTELQHILPNENFVFVADQLYVPYGEKSKKEIVKLAYRITDHLINNYDIKMMVVACNTATCGAIGELRNKYQFPIVGVAPAIKPAGEKTKTGTIAVISTPYTSHSRLLKNLVKVYCPDINVLNIGCKNLENVVETGELEGSLARSLIIKYLTQIRDSNADYLVLGCTHYEFLKKSIGKFVGRRIKLLDGKVAIAKHTKSLLANYFMESSRKTKGKTRYFTTGDPLKFSKVASNLLKTRVKAKKVRI